MKVTVDDLKKLFIEVGMDAKFVNDLDIDKPIGGQGFESVFCPAVMLAVKDKYNFEIPLEACPRNLNMGQLAAYLEKNIP